MRSPLSRFFASLSLPAVLAVAAAGRAAADVVVEEVTPAAVAPGTRVDVGPAGVRVEIQAGPPLVPAEAGAVVRREPYLGVVPAPVSDELRAQLELPAGVGLAVEAVSKDGPADRAGVRRFDILTNFDDQVVCAPEQLSTLVKAAGKGKPVILTVIRGGKELAVEVTIAEREVAVGGPPAAVFGPFMPLPGFPVEVQVVPDPRWAEAVPGLGQGIRAHVQRQVARALEQAQQAVAGGDWGARVVQVYPQVGSRNRVVASDESGTVEIREADGRRTVTVRDAAGDLVHEGPLDTDADRARVPEAFRDSVTKVEGLLADAPQPAAAPTPAEEPAAEGGL